MKYYVTLKNKTYEVEVEDGEAVLLSETDNGGSPVAAEQHTASKNVSVQKSTDSQARTMVSASVRAVPSAAPAAPVIPTAPAEAGAVVAPMPGNILNVCVAEGQQVNEGDVVVILEAMKMENEIVATASGAVQKIMVTKGQTVQTGAPLVVIG